MMEIWREASLINVNCRQAKTTIHFFVRKGSNLVSSMTFSFITILEVFVLQLRKLLGTNDHKVKKDVSKQHMMQVYDCDM